MKCVQAHFTLSKMGTLIRNMKARGESAKGSQSSFSKSKGNSVFTFTTFLYAIVRSTIGHGEMNNFAENSLLTHPHMPIQCTAPNIREIHDF